MEDFEVLKMLGSGSFGEVYLAKHRSTQKLLCTKVVKLNDMPEKEKEACKVEVRLMKNLKHPNIVGYVDSFLYRNCLCIVMEYCDGGDLAQRVKLANGILLPEAKILSWFTQVCMGLHYMHSKRVLHRDIKSQNIFILASGRIVLGDLGVSKVLQRGSDFASTCIGTPYYMSPEIFKGNSYNHKSDVWALGCVLYELCTLKHAFDANSYYNLASKVAKGKYPPISQSYSKELKDLVAELLLTDPKRRPDTEQVLKSDACRLTVKAVVAGMRETTDSMLKADEVMKELEQQLSSLGLRDVQSLRVKGSGSIFKDLDDEEERQLAARMALKSLRGKGGQEQHMLQRAGSRGSLHLGRNSPAGGSVRTRSPSPRGHGGQEAQQLVIPKIEVKQIQRVNSRSRLPSPDSGRAPRSARSRSPAIGSPGGARSRSGSIAGSPASDQAVPIPRSRSGSVASPSALDIRKAAQDALLEADEEGLTPITAPPRAPRNSSLPGSAGVGAVGVPPLPLAQMPRKMRVNLPSLSIPPLHAPQSNSEKVGGRLSGGRLGSPSSLAVQANPGHRLPPSVSRTPKQESGGAAADDSEVDLLETLRKEARKHEKYDDEAFEAVHARERELTRRLKEAEGRQRELQNLLDQRNAEKAQMPTAKEQGEIIRPECPEEESSSEDCDQKSKRSSFGDKSTISRVSLHYVDEENGQTEGESSFCESTMPNIEDAPTPKSVMTDRGKCLRNRCIERVGKAKFDQAFDVLGKLMDDHGDGYVVLNGRTYDGADEAQVELALEAILGKPNMHIWQLLDQLLLMEAQWD